MGKKARRRPRGPSPARKKEIFRRVGEIATMAGIQLHEVEKGHPLAGLPAAGFNMPGNRSQRVFIRPAAEQEDGNTIITFVSPCLWVKTGFLKGMSKAQAIDLLTRNEDLYFARYGIWRMDGGDMVVASADQILETMESEEFSALVQNVAMAADAYEAEHGGDDF